MIGKILFFGVVGLAVGCGGSVYEIPSDTNYEADSGSADGASRDGAAHDTGTHDAHTTDSGGLYACGTTVCQGTDLCVHPCCGGAPPACTPVLDGGGCAPGETFELNCFSPGGSGPGCMPPPCKPPPAYCSPKGSDTCGPPQNGSRDVSCLCG